MLGDSTVAVVVMRTRPRAIPLPNHEKISSWVFVPYMVMGLPLAALRAAGAPLILLLVDVVLNNMALSKFLSKIFMRFYI